VKDKKQFVW